MRVWWGVLATVVGLWLTLLDCSGGSGASAGSCTSKGSCPNDPPPTQSEVAQCTALWNDSKCGPLFQSYFACAAQQEVCTSGGTIDDSATRAAISSSCSQQIAAYKACTPGGPSCGAAGDPCCAGAAPCMGGCCDPATQRCVGFFQPCSTSGQRCSTTSCTVCGEPGQPCCGILCDNGCCVDQGDAGTGGDAGVCIAAGDSCSASGLPGVCTFSPSSVRGYCEFCGGTSNPCCKGGVCETGLSCSAGACR
jgi:hypothetical protein